MNLDCKEDNNRLVQLPVVFSSNFFFKYSQFCFIFASFVSIFIYKVLNLVVDEDPRFSLKEIIKKWQERYKTGFLEKKHLEITTRNRNSLDQKVTDYP